MFTAPSQGSSDPFAPLALRIKQLMQKDEQAVTSSGCIWVPCLLVFMVITALYTLGFLMTQAMGAGILLEALSGFDYRLGMVVVIGVSTIYTLYGGMRAVIGTDFIQSLLIMGLLVLVAVLAFRQFPVDLVHSRLLESHPQRLDLLLPAGLLMAWNGAPSGGGLQQHLVVTRVCQPSIRRDAVVRAGRPGLN